MVLVKQRRVNRVRDPGRTRNPGGLARGRGSTPPPSATYVDPEGNTCLVLCQSASGAWLVSYDDGDLGLWPHDDLRRLP